MHCVKEPNEFFVMTNLWKTCNQTQGVCAEVRYTHSHVHTVCEHVQEIDN